MKGHPLKVFAFLAPNLTGFLLFTLGPVAATLLLSFFSWDLFEPPRFVGLGNYTALLGMELTSGDLLIAGILTFGAIASACLYLFRKGKAGGWFLLSAVLLGCATGAWLVYRGLPWTPKLWQSLWNTFYLLVGLPIGMAGSLLLAVFLNEKVFGNHFFRLVYFLPSVVGGVGVYLLWKWIFHPDIGPVNLLLTHLFGVAGPTWFDSSLWAKPALIIMNLWGSVGGTNMILYLAALQSIDPGLYEAAEMDGASMTQKFWNVTLPMVSSTTVFILIMGIIHGFQGGFDAAYVITRGGPAGATTTVNYFIYESAFQHLEFGFASATSVLLFLLVLAMSWVNWKVAANRIHYT